MQNPIYLDEPLPGYPNEYAPVRILNDADVRFRVLGKLAGNLDVVRQARAAEFAKAAE
jgi:hypothetical protein